MVTGDVKREWGRGAEKGGTGRVVLGRGAGKREWWAGKSWEGRDWKGEWGRERREEGAGKEGRGEGAGRIGAGWYYLSW